MRNRYFFVQKEKLRRALNMTRTSAADEGNSFTYMNNENIIKANQGDTFSMMGLKITIKQSADASNGLVSILEQTVAPGAGSPPHICSQEDKIIYILEGTFDVLLDSDIYSCTAGDTIRIPKGQRHNFKNAGSQEGKILVTLTPGGHEQFLKELSQLLQHAAPGMETLKAVAFKHDIVLG